MAVACRTNMTAVAEHSIPLLGTSPVKIPCAAGTHWRYIELLCSLEADSFDAVGFRDRLGKKTTRYWIAVDGENPECHTHVRLEEVNRSTSSSAEEGASVQTRWVLELETYRFRAKPSDKATIISHQEVFGALRDCANAQQLRIVARVDLYYSAETTQWRTSLLAKPPEITELQDDLGKISLAGLVLRFHGSLPGLLEARLEVSPDESEYFASIRFGHLVNREALNTIYEDISSTAEHFADLFINAQS